MQPTATLVEQWTDGLVAGANRVFIDHEPTVCSIRRVGNPTQTPDLNRFVYFWASPKIRTATKTATSIETSYYLLSTKLSAERFGQVVRSHWGVENPLHWCLDVVMNEDQARNRMDNGPHNLAILRHMALNVLRRDTTKGSLRGKFKRAGWKDDYPSSLLALF